MMRHFPLRQCGVLLLLAGLIACGSSAKSTAPMQLELDVEGTLAAGATAMVKGTDLEVSFVGVTEDSRCPTDTTCIWAGEVTVKLAMHLGTQAPAERELLEGRSTVFEPYRLTVTRVRPEPKSTQKIQPADYRINLIVVKI